MILTPPSHNEQGSEQAGASQSAERTHTIPVPVEGIGTVDVFRTVLGPGEHVFVPTGEDAGSVPVVYGSPEMDNATFAVLAVVRQAPGARLSQEERTRVGEYTQRLQDGGIGSLSEDEHHDLEALSVRINETVDAALRPSYADVQTGLKSRALVIEGVQVLQRGYEGQPPLAFAAGLSELTGAHRAIVEAYVRRCLGSVVVRPLGDSGPGSAFGSANSEVWTFKGVGSADDERPSQPVDLQTQPVVSALSAGRQPIAAVLGYLPSQNEVVIAGANAYLGPQGQTYALMVDTLVPIDVLPDAPPFAEELQTELTGRRRVPGLPPGIANTMTRSPAPVNVALSYGNTGPPAKSGLWGKLSKFTKR